jgi:hypothetical protein
MYTIDEHDRVEELLDFPKMDVGAPEPRILWDEHGTFLAYRCSEGRTPPGVNTCLVITEGSNIIAGWPNEEVLRSHPLYSRGLSYYSINRVVNSSWIRQVERGNSVHPQHRPEMFVGRTHLLFAFHDSTIELMVRSYTIKTSPLEVEDAFREAIAR